MEARYVGVKQRKRGRCRGNRSLMTCDRSGLRYGARIASGRQAVNWTLVQRDEHVGAIRGPRIVRPVAISGLQAPLLEPDRNNRAMRLAGPRSSR
jgi:hypothetical protein